MSDTQAGYKIDSDKHAKQVAKYKKIMEKQS